MRVARWSGFVRVMAVCGWLLLPVTVLSDELLMQDGSRLVGRVVKVKEGAVEFETSFAGTLKVEWSQLREMTVEQPVDVFLDNSEVLQVTGVRVSGDTLTLQQASAPEREIAGQQFVSINPEPWERGVGIRFTGRANTGLEIQRGNTVQEKLGLDTEMRLRRLNDRAILVAQYQRDRSDAVITAQNWLVRSKYDYFLSDKRYFGATLNFENDRFADLKLRTSLGPHLGYQFYEGKQMNLAADMSLLYVMDKFYAATDDEYSALGWSLDFDRMLLGERLQFYHRHNGLLGSFEWDSLVFRSWTGLRFPIYGGLNASTEIQVDYSANAPIGVDKIDSVWRLKLGYQW